SPKKPGPSIDASCDGSRPSISFPNAIRKHSCAPSTLSSPLEKQAEFLQARRMKRVILDTSCVRGTPRWQLEELERRGFKIGISVLALDELLVYFTADAQKDKKQEQLRARLSWFNEHFRGDVPLRPTHAPLVNMLGGRLVRE